MPESKRRTAAKKATATEVNAEDIKVGDDIWFPNSRKPQPVTSVTTEEDGDRSVIRLSTEGTTWNVMPGYKVRRA